MKLLGIDTSGNNASAAVCTPDRVLAQHTVYVSRGHSQVILPMAKAVLQESGCSWEELDGFVVADGPGSYTGLRIGVAAVKAMAFALKKPCLGVSTLEALSYNVRAGVVCPVMAARQDLAYTGLFRWNGKEMERLEDDQVLSVEKIFSKLTRLDGPVTLTGDLAPACEKDFSSPHITAAPLHLRNQLASSLCLAGFAHEERFSGPDRLEARYLQPTKAEKDRLEAGR